MLVPQQALSTPTLRESFAYGEDFVFANQRRQGGNEERDFRVADELRR
jgi:hypothetical protein